MVAPKRNGFTSEHILLIGRWLCFFQQSKYTKLQMLSSSLRGRGREPSFLIRTLLDPSSNRTVCPKCNNIHSSTLKCKIACHYCHEFHQAKDLIDNMCPAMYPQAKKLQEKHSYQCKECKGEGSFTQETEITKYQSNKKYQERLKQWILLPKKQGSQDQKPTRRILSKAKTKKEIQCFYCQGKGRIMRMIFCCNEGCRNCKGDKYIINSTWQMYRKEPIQNEVKFQCSICLTDVQALGQKFMLQCRHQFHPECILKWMTSKNSCPVCRKADIYLSHERRDQLEDIQHFIPFQMQMDSEEDW